MTTKSGSNPKPTPVPAVSNFAEESFDQLAQAGVIKTFGSGLSASIKLPAYGLAAAVVTVRTGARAAGRFVDTTARFMNIGSIAYNAAALASERALGISGNTDSATYLAESKALADRIYDSCSSK